MGDLMVNNCFTNNYKHRSDTKHEEENVFIVCDFWGKGITHLYLHD